MRSEFSRTRRERHRGRSLQSCSPLYLWLASLSLLAAIVGWIVLDPGFHAAADDLRVASGWIGAEDGAPNSSAVGAARQWLLPTAIGLGVILQAATLGLLFVGSRSHRSLASWMVFFALGGLWLTTALQWRDISWWGKQQRLRVQLAGFEKVAHELRGQWPAEDGALSSRDPFMAYPVGDPSVLIMLTLPVLPHTSTTFGVVERSDDGALRFELAGAETGDWLEWHPGDSRPHSFVGGLLEARELLRTIPLGRGWHLARYEKATGASVAQAAVR